MAITEVKVAIAKVLQNFDISMDASYKPTKKTTVTTRPEPVGPEIQLKLKEG